MIVSLAENISCRWGERIDLDHLLPPAASNADAAGLEHLFLLRLGTWPLVRSIETETSAPFVWRWGFGAAERPIESRSVVDRAGEPTKRVERMRQCGYPRHRDGLMGALEADNTAERRWPDHRAHGLCAKGGSGHARSHRSG